MPFLEVLTRHLATRAELLARCTASIDRQTDDDWVQTLLIDDVGRGVEWANGNMGRYAPHLEGEYIWILDDDDECICETLVADLKSIVDECAPDVIMVKGEINRHGILPDAAVWGNRPVFAHIAMPNFFLRRDVWQKHAPMLDVERGADYQMIRDVFDADCYRIHWHDAIVARAEMARFGAAQ